MIQTNVNPSQYRGRIAPTPTGYLHLGHAATFLTAFQRAREAGGRIVYRDEDLDPHRCKAIYANAALEDLRWLGIACDEEPPPSPKPSPLRQSSRRETYIAAWRLLQNLGLIYPTLASRRQIARFAHPLHDSNEQDPEPIFPTRFRTPPAIVSTNSTPTPGFAWRFRIPKSRTVRFIDGRLGKQAFEAGSDFGDFIVWRPDGIPSYELAVVVDDLAMGVTEVVRGEDLLRSTARQILLYEALEATPPKWFHTPLLNDPTGRRLAKRDNARSIRSFREQGFTPEKLIREEIFLKPSGCAPKVVEFLDIVSRDRDCS